MNAFTEIRDIMMTDLKTLSPEATVIEAAQIMAQYKIGTVVIKEKGKLVAIISETDLSRKCLARNENPERFKLRALMSADLYSISGEKTVLDAMDMMNELGVRHLVVVDGEKIGMVSVRDILNCFE